MFFKEYICCSMAAWTAAMSPELIASKICRIVAELLVVIVHAPLPTSVFHHVQRNVWAVSHSARA